MLSTQALVLMVALSGAGTTELLHFTAPWCGPCQMMEPAVRRMHDAGYSIRPIDVDRQPDIAAQYQVRSLPCFVLVVNGREVDRLVGATSFDRLQQMVAQGMALSGTGGTATVRAQSPDAPAEAPGHEPPRLAAEFPAARQPLAAANSASPVPRALAATVRLKVEDPHGQSYGTGTVIDVHGDEALVVTCGHIFRDSQGQGQILVDLFAPGAGGPVPGKLIAYDLSRDVGLVSIRPGLQLAAAPVAGRAIRVGRDDHVFSIGCDRGGEPRVEEGRVMAVNKYLGPQNVVVSGQPVDGRSGGGLFSSDGQLIGICNAADPASNEGLYAAITEVHAELDSAGLAFIYRRADEIAAAPSSPMTPAAGPQPDVGLPAPVELAAQQSPAASPDIVPAQASAHANSLPSGNDVMEVVCIVRARDSASSSSRVIVLDRPSESFLNQLNAEWRSQSAAVPTSLRITR